MNKPKLVAQWVFIHSFAIFGTAFAHFDKVEEFTLRFNSAIIMLILAYIIRTLANMQDPVKNCKLCKDKENSMEDKFLKDIPLENVNIKNAKIQLFLASPPNPVGGYRIGKEFQYSVQFNLEYKPNWLHRFFMKTCLGFHWFNKFEGNK